LSTYGTAQVLNTISQTHPELAAEASALRSQVLGVLAARQTALKPTPSQSHVLTATRASALTPADLQQGLQQLRTARTQVQRVQALKQLQAQVTRLNGTLTAARAGNAFQNQIEFNLMKAGLEKMQAWLSDSQRLQEASQLSQALWQGAVAVVAALAAAALYGNQALRME
jgi:predicted DNA-binding ribbon-helix-helix protein